MMCSSRIVKIYKNSALQDIFLKLPFIEYTGLQEDTPYMRK